MPHHGETLQSLSSRVLFLEEAGALKSSPCRIYSYSELTQRGRRGWGQLFSMHMMQTTFSEDSVANVVRVAWIWPSEITQKS